MSRRSRLYQLASDVFSALDPEPDEDDDVDHEGGIDITPKRLAYSGPWCCAQGLQLGVPVCPECAWASSAYSAAMAPAREGERRH